MAGSGIDGIAAVMGRIPSGCCILTAGHEDRHMGILASWIQQVSFEPLMVVVAVKPDRPILNVIESSGHFILNLIDEQHQRMLFKHFAKFSASSGEVFSELATRQTPEGVILEDCLGYLTCRVASRLPTGDHLLLTAEVSAGGMLTAGEPYVHLRKSAVSY